MVKFSVITVCLNAGATIKRCLDSVANQSFRDFEHIVVDGMSKDDTLDIVKSYSHVKWVCEKDSGIYDAMNKGVGLSNGEYIVFLNSDDEFLPNFLDQCQCLKEVDFISNAINMLSETNLRIWCPKPIKRKDFIWSMPIPHAGLVVKKQVFQDIGLFDLKFRIAADFDFVIRLLKENYTGKYNKDPQLNFYLGGISNDFRVIKENNNVRAKHYNKFFKLKIAYLLDLLRYIKNNVLS
ncbi:glycosyltransferase family 2 protein [Sphingobacterium detergens]